MARILVVDDNEDMLDTLEHLFSFYNFEVIRARNGKEAIEVAENQFPDLIVLDALMPVMNGFDACKVLKSNPRTRDIPIVFLSANYTEDDHRVHGLELGADDYILKPFNAKELIVKVRSLLNKKQLIDKLQSDREQLKQRQEEFKRELEQLKARARELGKLTFMDPLTGVYSESFFPRRAQEEIERAKRYQQALSLVLLDVDHFGQLNSVFGEQVGDYLLSKIAAVVTQNTRTTDIVFKQPGNRFAILLPNTDEAGAFYEAERLRAAVEQTDFFDAPLPRLKDLSPDQERSFKRVTVSGGVSGWQKEIQEVKAWLQRAEQALLQAKATGRNRCVRFNEIEND
ncbi:MAG: diguanylate cyclase [Calditrichaeota bacterium]|nr:MAG: diguanylate cyclase [Calditrichota bacterium]